MKFWSKLAKQSTNMTSANQAHIRLKGWQLLCNKMYVTDVSCCINLRWEAEKIEMCVIIFHDVWSKFKMTLFGIQIVFSVREFCHIYVNTNYITLCIFNLLCLWKFHTHYTNKAKNMAIWITPRAFFIQRVTQNKRVAYFFFFLVSVSIWNFLKGGRLIRLLFTRCARCWSQKAEKVSLRSDIWCSIRPLSCARSNNREG